jgi:hypothetical protein
VNWQTATEVSSEPHVSDYLDPENGGSELVGNIYETTRHIPEDFHLY